MEGNNVEDGNWSGRHSFFLNTEEEGKTGGSRRKTV
jgi:hypothetical protein